MEQDKKPQVFIGKKGSVWLLLFLILLSGCQKTAGPAQSGPVQNCCGNSVMGNGTFLMDGPAVYYTDKDRMYRYDMEKKETLASPVIDVFGQLNLRGETIYYKDLSKGSLCSMGTNGTKGQTVYENTQGESMAQIYMEGDICYYLTGYGGRLIRVDLTSGKEEVLCETVRSFYITGEKIYVIQQTAPGEAKTKLLVSGKDSPDFKRIRLSFDPISVYPVQQGTETVLYLNHVGSYELTAVSEEGRILRELPVHTLYYQVSGGILYYMDQDSFETDYKLMAYNLDTEETRVLAENVFDFCVLEERYIGICQLFKETYLLYDGEMKEMWNISMDHEGKA